MKHQNLLRIITVMICSTLVIVIGLRLTRPVSAANGINKVITFQGKVTNASGTNVTDGTYDFTIKLYDGAGSSASTLFTESWISSSLWFSTMSSAPASGGQSLTYSSDTNESTIKVGQILWNTTKKESVIVTSVNTSTNVIGISPTRQAWATSDTVTNKIYVKDGVFKVAINSLNQDLSGVNFNTDSIFMGVEFNNDGEMKPRIQYTASPYAFDAEKVNGLTVTNSSGSSFASSTTLKLNDGSTVSFGGNFTTSGSNALTLKTSATTNATLPSGTVTLVATDSNDILTNKTIGSTGLTFSGATTDITTGTNEDLVLKPNGTGNVGVGTTAPVGKFNVANSGLTAIGKALGIFDQYENQDIFTASAAGTTEFVIAKDGTVTMSKYTSGGLLYTNSSGVINQTSTSTSTNCLKGDLTWGSCGSGTSLFTADSGGVFTYLTSTTQDLLLGGSTVASGAFYLHVTDGASPANTTLSLGTDGSKNGILKLWSSTSSKPGTIGMDSSGNLNVTATAGQVVLSGSSGNITLDPGSSNLVANLSSTGDFLIQKGGSSYAIFDHLGNVGIGTTTPTAKLQVLGIGTGPTASISANTSFAGLLVDNTIGDLFTASSSGLTRFTVTQGGNVGIGSTTPGSKLDVTAISGADSWIMRLFRGATQVNSVDSNGFVSFTPTTTSTTGTIFNFGGNGASTTNFMLLNAPSLNSGNLINIAKNSVTKFLVDTNGNVGIGTTAPGGMFNVANNGLTALGKAIGIFDQYEAQDIFTASAAGQTRFVINNSGNVGLGTGTPVAKLDLALGTNAQKLLLYTNSNFRYGFGIQASELRTFAAQGAVHTFGTISSGDGSTFTEFMRLDGNGNLGIGTNSPKGLLSVSGATTGQALVQLNQTGDQAVLTASVSGTPVFTINNIGMMSFTPLAGGPLGGQVFNFAGSAAAFGGDFFLINAPSNNSGNLFDVQKSGVGKLVVSSNGNVGIGTTSPNGLLNVSGAATGQALVQLNQIGDQDVLAASVAGTTRFVVKNSGNVGIGLSNPTAAKFVISDSSQAPGVDMAEISATTGITTDGVDGLQIDVANAGTGVQTNAGLTVNVTSNNTNASSNLYGINIGNLTSGGEASNEVALNIGTGWDKGIVIASGGSTNSGLAYTGAGRPTKTIVLSAEYPGAVLTASGSASTNTIGSMTSDASPSAALSNYENYYQWTSSQTSLNDYTVAVRVTLPKDFSDWDSTSNNAMKIYFNTALTTSASNKLDVFVYNTDSSLASPGTPVVYRQANTSSVVKTWTSVNIDRSDLIDGAEGLTAAGKTMVIYLKMYAKDNNYVQVGDIVLNYLAAF